MKILASDLSEFECSTPILTLDCFDTIFWRRVKTPHDIFYLLQEHPLYKQYGFSASDRGGFESQARLTQKALNNSTEVRLEDIYRHGLQLRGVVDKDGAIVQRLVALEIAIEIEHGVLFKPLCALIERAQRKGCKVVVVSDTYSVWRS